TSGDLTKHSRIHLDDEDPRKKRFKCEKCEKWFGTNADRNKHSRIHKDSEEDRRPFKCEDCSKRFGQS
ncbi:hypothetical protein PMAYCL1PPCAC_08666, partial [Pristionchus mayeri]